jgi:surfeit locus 1 family protein
LWPTLGFVVGVSIAIAAGLWQGQRADEKRALQETYDRRAQEAPIVLGAAVQAAETLRYRRVRVRGQYEVAHQVLHDNRVHQHQAGYHVITPLRVEGSDTRVLVNRGWIPLGASREHLPQIETPDTPVEITGVAAVPSPPPLALGRGPAEGSWSKVWQHLDLQRYAATVPFPVQPVVVLLDPQSPAGGFARDWVRLDAGIAVHQGYAFQWFALALTLTVIYLYFGYRRARPRPEENDALES